MLVLVWFWCSDVLSRYVLTIVQCTGSTRNSLSPLHPDSNVTVERKKSQRCFQAVMAFMEHDWKLQDKQLLNLNTEIQWHN